MCFCLISWSGRERSASFFVIGVKAVDMVSHTGMES